ncbi:MAG: hypothetical protein EPN21_18500 [Methylococcaceae bacterium]|nr:MAG: hypothetical protein EPN21_18500 [Methylococcaceae bacterium]
MTIQRVACAWIMAGSAMCAWAEDYYGHINSGLGYNDNVTRGADDSFRRGDFTYRVGGAVGTNWRMSERSGLALELQVDGNQFQRFERLSSLRGALLTRALFKPFETYGAPWLALESEAELIGHKDSALRDRWGWSGRALSGARLTDRVSASLGYQYSLSRGSQWGVWNSETHTLLAGMEYELTQQWKLFLDYQMGVGKFNASATWSPTTWSPAAWPSPRPGGAMPSYDARWRDKALEAEANTVVYSYLLDGVNQQLTVGSLWMFAPDWQLTLSGQYFALDGEAGAFYQGFGANAGVDYRF